MSSLDARLDVLRGTSLPLPHNARTLAALTANPACDRRSLIDAAGIDKDALAAHLGLPRPLRKSQLALKHGLAFEHRVIGRDHAELVRLLREALDLALPEVAYEDLNSVANGEDRSSPQLRHARTRSLIISAATNKSAPRTLLNHPVLRLPVAGHHVYLEPDVVAFHHDGTFHVVEIKSFPVIYGQADPASVAAALTQTAAYVLALRDLLADEGLPPERVSDTVVLINPLNFTQRPTATLESAHRQIRSLRRHLDRLRRLPELLDQLPLDTTFDLALDPHGKPTRPRSELTAALARLNPLYTPHCRRHCDLAIHCRNEARSRDRTEALGTTVREDIAGITTVTTALDLADGRLHPADAQEDITRALRHAQRLYTDLQAGTA
ncbi:hypothetical protein ACFWD7_23640 [Streptomyces mirabilis]|uniref:hypothetical protein n=1 Tax=Streptomyces mirabilis TaxID=68239 RepID=UPI0036871780